MSLSRRKEEAEYELDDVDDSMNASLGKRLAKFVKEFSIQKKLSTFRSVDRIPLGNFYIERNDKKYQLWWLFVVITALYSSMFTPLEFGFFRGLPHFLWLADLAVQFIFITDIFLRFFEAYRDPETYKLVTEHRRIALRYIKSDFFVDILGCFPWDTIYKAFGKKEEVRYLVWLRLYRVRKVNEFFVKMEKDIRISYFGTRIAKLLAVEFYCTHTAACIFYYLATTLPPSKEQYTWIGSLSLGSYSYENFRALDLGKRYVTSLYWAIITMATVGYGDIHAVNSREMIFVMIYVSLDMILGAYLVGNMTALIVKGSNTEKFRDKMTSLIKFMNRNGLPREIRVQMKNHVRLQFESGTMTEENVVQHLPMTLRSKVSQSLFSSVIEHVPLFGGCSNEFLNQIVSKVIEEHFLPGEIVIQQGSASDQFYIVAHGALDEIIVADDGTEEIIGKLEAESICGEVGVLCNIPQPFTVRVSELCRLLRLDKQTFTEIVQIYFNDGRILINNLLEWKDTDARVGQLAADITFLVAKQQAELALMVNNAAYQGDIVQLKQLVKAGAVTARADYDGRTPLHLAASKGYDGVVEFLIREGNDVNAIDKFGITPLLEAVKGGHDQTMSLLLDKGAELHLQDAGSLLCQTVTKGNSELLRRLIHAGANICASDYDHRTALHLAAAEGSVMIAKMLIETDADLFAQDRVSAKMCTIQPRKTGLEFMLHPTILRLVSISRWGRTPLDEAELHKRTSVIPLLKQAAENKTREKSSSTMKSTMRSRKSTTSQKETSEADTKSLEERVADAREQLCLPTSPRSTDSSAGTPRKLYIDRQLWSQRRLERLTTLGVVPGHRSTSMESESEDLASRYRELPSRRMGRQFTLQPSLTRLDQRRSKRVTIFPYHPWTPSNLRTIGRVEWVPDSIADVLDLAAQYFDKHGTKILNQDGGEITSCDLIGDMEKIYVVDDDDLLTTESPEQS